MRPIRHKHLPSAEERALLAKAREIQNRVRKANKKERAPKVRPSAEGQRDPRELDAAFISWLHHDIPCIACEIEGPGPAAHRAIEAAHQKVGRQKALGRRPSDKLSTPLCAWHHRYAPGCCDPAQGKFWDRLGVDPKRFCEDLHAAFQADEPGAPVVTKHLSLRYAGAATHG